MGEERPRPVATRRLNSQDRAALIADDVFRSMGHPGMNCQAQLWFDGRLDEDRLRSALRDLAGVHPAVCGRLVRPWSFRKTHWRFPVSAEPAFEVRRVADDAEATVLESASEVFVHPLDLETEPPIRFFVLRRPSAGDVLLLQYSHVLMDGRGPEALIEDLSRVDRGEEVRRPDPTGDTDQVVEWLREHPLLTRLRSRGKEFLRRVAESRRDGRVPLVALTEPDTPGWVNGRVHVATRALDEAASASIRTRARETVGFENLTPVLLASVFRAVERTAASEIPDEAVFRVHLPISLRPSFREPVPALCNLSSFVRVYAERGELADREALARALFRRLRRGLRGGNDIAWAETFRWLGHRSEPLRRSLVRKHVKSDVSLTFGYIGRVSDRMSELLGARADRFHTLTFPTSKPALAVNDMDGRLHLGMSYMTEALSTERAEAFMDAVVEDLAP